ncbi:MAG: hypothetical protein ACLQVX_03395 [Limisphaerales bacterium]
MSETISTVSNIAADLKPKLPAKLISELVADPGFPKSAVGEKVDIKGFIGVVVDVVNNSIKVRSEAGNTVSYNFNALRRIYGPRTAPENEPIAQAPASSTAPQPQKEAERKRNFIAEPNFNSPLVPIERLVHRPDFPGCALGLFVDLHGFAGVVVELVGHSLKVRSQQGSTHSYNADGLRKLYGGLPSGGSPAKA